MPPLQPENMLEELPALFELQQIDLKIGKVEAERAKLDDGSQLSQELQLLAAELERLRKQVREHEGNRSDKRLESQGMRDRMQEFADQLYKGSGAQADQVQVIQMELESLQKRMLELEEDSQRLAETIQHLQEEMVQKEAQHEEKSDRLAHTQSQFKEDVQSYDEELTRLRKERATLLKGISPDAASRYELIRTRSDNLAVVEITGSVCPGCFIELTPFILRRLQELESLQHCENCHRILYWRGERRQPQSVEDLADYLQGAARERQRT